MKFGQSLKLVKGDQIRLGTLRFRFYVKIEKIASLQLDKPQASVEPTIQHNIEPINLQSTKYHIERGPSCSLQEKKPTTTVKPIIKRDIRLADLRSKGYQVNKRPFCRLPADFNRDYFSFKDMQAAYRFHRENYESSRVQARTFANYDSDD